MEYVLIGLYIGFMAMLGGIVLFNIIYRQQVKRMENILSIHVSAHLIRLRDLDMAIPSVIFLIALVIALVRLLQ